MVGIQASIEFMTTKDKIRLVQATVARLENARIELAKQRVVLEGLLEEIRKI